MQETKKKIKKKFDYKDRAFQIIKERFKEFAIVDESDCFYVIAYKKNMEVITRFESHIFNPTEKKESSDYCILKIIRFMDIPSKVVLKQLLAWDELGCREDFITLEGYYIDNKPFIGRK